MPRKPGNACDFGWKAPRWSYPQNETRKTSSR